MEDASINMFDLGVLIIVGLSALLSFFRGFVREVLSLAAWVVASIVTLRLLPAASAYVKPQVKSEVIANGIASVGVFFITLILMSIAISLFMKAVKPGDKVGLFDNLLGLAFGVARGLLIVAIAYFVMSVVLVEKDYPDWVKHSMSKPYIEEISKTIGRIAPDYLDKVTDKKNESSEESDISEESEKKTKELLKKLDRAREKANSKMDDALEKVDDAAADIEEKASSMPSIEDLQKRIREENERNEKNNVR